MLTVEQRKAFRAKREAINEAGAVAGHAAVAILTGIPTDESVLPTEQRSELSAFRAALDIAGSVLTDEQALEAITLYRFWVAGETVTVGDKRRYGDGLYRCREGHATQDNWSPDRASTLWERITVQDWAAWAPGTYAAGAKVTHNGVRWINQVDSNHWEPGAAGVYENIWKEAI